MYLYVYSDLQWHIRLQDVHNLRVSQLQYWSQSDVFFVRRFCSRILRGMYIACPHNNILYTDSPNLSVQFNILIQDLSLVFMIIYLESFVCHESYYILCTNIQCIYNFAQQKIAHIILLKCWSKDS